MLILARKAGEAIVINDDIIVRVLEIKGGQIKMGVEAPSRVTIHREEIFQRLVEENKRAAQQEPLDLAAMVGALKDGSWKLLIQDGGLLGSRTILPGGDESVGLGKGRR